MFNKESFAHPENKNLCFHQEHKFLIYLYFQNNEIRYGGFSQGGRVDLFCLRDHNSARDNEKIFISPVRHNKGYFDIKDRDNKFDWMQINSIVLDPKKNLPFIETNNIKEFKLFLCHRYREGRCNFPRDVREFPIIVSPRTFWKNTIYDQTYRIFNNRHSEYEEHYIELKHYIEFKPDFEVEDGFYYYNMVVDCTFFNMGKNNYTSDRYAESLEEEIKRKNAPPEVKSNSAPENHFKPEAVKRIRKKRREEGATIRSIAKEEERSHSTISDMCNYKTYNSEEYLTETDKEIIKNKQKKREHNDTKN